MWMNLLEFFDIVVDIRALRHVTFDPDALVIIETV
jgi:hypothetical protein